MSSDEKKRKTPQQSCLGRFFPVAKRLRSASRRIVFDENPACSSIRPKKLLDALTNVRKDGFHIFNDAPLEIAEKFFADMDLKTIGQLSLVDHRCRKLVSVYAMSKPFLDRVRRVLKLLKNSEYPTVDEMFTYFANIFKRSTMILPTQERLSAVQAFYLSFGEHEYRDIVVARRWGVFWHRFMRGWEYLECSKAFSILVSHGKDASIQRLLTNFFNNEPGKWQQNEYRLRVFFRNFLLDYSFNKNEDVGFWLSTVLSTFTMYHQAKLLYLIFGSADDDLKKIEWQKLSTFAVSVRTGETFFKKVVDSLRFLQIHAPAKWTNDTVVSLIEELTSFPDGWLLENFAYFLLYCEESVIVGILTSRIINGRLEEVCSVLSSMCLCICRTTRTMNFMIQLFFKILTEIPAATRSRLLQTFAKQSSVRYEELHHSFPIQFVREEINAMEGFFGIVLSIACRNMVQAPEVSALSVDDNISINSWGLMERKEMSKKVGRNEKPAGAVSKVGRYKIIRTIGRGNFAVVKLAKHEITHTKVAIKIVDKRRLDEENLRKVYREIQILKSLRHPHIIQLFQVIETDSKLFLVTEYANGGEVFEHLQKQNRMSEREARHVFRQIVAAVAYCHASGVVHRDLKAENLLFHSKTTIKLVDFGFSNFHHDGNLLQTWCGSPPYAAPELFLGENYDGTKADCWSLGVVLYILVCGGFPFPSNSIERLKEAVLIGQVNIPFYVSVECSDLIRKLLVVDTIQRFSVKQVIQHRWFCASDWNENWESLFRLSVEPRLSSVTHSLNHTCIFYMQQRGYSPDKVAEAVLEKRFDDEYGTYFLLIDKIEKGVVLQKSSNLAIDDSLLSNNLPRRGSRGCLTTGQVNVEQFSETPTISTAHLVTLSQFSPDEESHSSDSEGSLSETSAYGMQNYLSYRRHTALGVAGHSAYGLASDHHAHLDTATGCVTGFPVVPFPLVYQLGEVSNFAWTETAFRPPPIEPPRQSIFQDCGRRRSDGISCFPRRFKMASVVPTTVNGGGSTAYQTAPPLDTPHVAAEERNIDEAGARYLKTPRGTLKRHTVHGSNERTTVGLSNLELPSAANTHVSSSRHHSPLSGYPAGRHSRNNPFRTCSATTRRASDSAQLPPDLLRHLEKLYSTATQSDSPAGSMRQLQQEFTQLRANADGSQMLATSASDVWRSPRSSPSGQSLHMIVEHDTEHNNGFNKYNVASAAGGGSSLDHVSSFPSRINSAIQRVPPSLFSGASSSSKQQVGIDDSRRTFNQQAFSGGGGGCQMEISSETSTFTQQPHADPVENFQRFASDLLFTAPSISAQMTATISAQITATTSSVSEASIYHQASMDPYFYSYPLPLIISPVSTYNSNNIYQPPAAVVPKKETVLSSRTISFISLQLRRVLNRMKIQYRDLAPSHGDGDSAGNSRRVSVESDDGTKVEIGVSAADHTGGLNKVDFHCVEGDYVRYQELCSEVLAGLNL